MMWLKFYFFTFYHHFKEKNYKNHSPLWYRAMLVMALSLFFIFLTLLLIIKFCTGYIFINRINAAIFSALMFTFIYLSFVKNGKAERIYDEFKNSEINTMRNRTLAWVVWGLTAFAVVALLIIDREVLHH
ncbi:hypothetical protein [Mucilaginibacter sp. CSA2-8R]|uniref:hypothetical protein n=1 Tax=Mucilaginibacter sp. CSA2-8R TaxID=3141542 RepID=UPI00315D4CDD